MVYTFVVARTVYMLTLAVVAETECRYRSRNKQPPGQGLGDCPPSYSRVIRSIWLILMFSRDRCEALALTQCKSSGRTRFVLFATCGSVTWVFLYANAP